MSKLLLLDVDSIVYTVAYTYRNKKSEKLVKMAVDKFITDVLTNSKADEYIGFYGSKEDGAKPNFRFDLYAKYKANRPTAEPYIVKWRPIIHNVFKDKWNFMPVDGMEADDAVAIAAAKHKDAYDEIIVATFDKDLKQIPNTTFYNMRKHEMESINEFQAYWNLSVQMLVGDSTDNIPGLPGIGKVKAPILLADCKTVNQLKLKVIRLYSETYAVMKKKKLAEIIKNIKTSLEPLADGSTDHILEDYKNLTGPRLERKIRINTAKDIETTMESFMLGGWKAYFKVQSGLLSMLTEEVGITIPDPIVSPLIALLGPTETVTVAPIISSQVDDFLTI